MRAQSPERRSRDLSRKYQWRADRSRSHPLRQLTANTLSVAWASHPAARSPHPTSPQLQHPASSTFTNFNVTNATATNATSTNLFCNPWPLHDRGHRYADVGRSDDHEPDRNNDHGNERNIDELLRKQLRRHERKRRLDAATIINRNEHVCWGGAIFFHRRRQCRNWHLHARAHAHHQWRPFD